MTVAAIVVAAGQGLRFGGPKQFAELGPESVASRSVRLARSVASHVVLVVPNHYVGDGEGADVTVTGGDTRAASVRHGLRECTDADIVVVHDAARPLASAELFELVVDAVKNGADAAIPGLAITDTVKRVRREDDVVYVAETLAREELVSVQTPQAFRREVLERAHAGASDATDDAALVEQSDGRVVVVDGETHNFKITSPDDLARARDLVVRES
jgi:2-C-methyl-D-erythritol 4-phosphate cytidylyltransferase